MRGIERLSIIILVVNLTMFSSILPCSYYNNQEDNAILTYKPLSLDTHSKEPIIFPSFPESIDFKVKIVFIGMNKSDINLTLLYQFLPSLSQISRYVPLSPFYETYINYSLSYESIFIEKEFSSSLSYSISSYGVFGLPTNMATYWSNRSTIGSYERSDPESVRNYIDSYINNYQTQDGLSPNLKDLQPTIFITNFFFNGSKYYEESAAFPHTYYLEEPDIDTLKLSERRKEARYSPGFDWTSKRWLFVDISSGPSPYETISDEYRNYIDYLFGQDKILLHEELGRIIRASIFSRYVPTYLYEPSWCQNIELRIVLYHDSTFDGPKYLNLNRIKEAFQILLPFCSFTINFINISCTEGCDLFTLLDYIRDYTDYNFWATQLINFVLDREIELFGKRKENIRYFTMGIIGSNEITGNDQALGYTLGEYGAPDAVGAVVTISPDTVLTMGEGFTQTTIHELGHMFSFRHPHDYRYNDQLYELWTLDFATTPLTYMYPVYYWHQLEKDTLYRGYFRWVFNESVYLKNTIDDELDTKNFPSDSYPDLIYTNLSVICSSLKSSVISFKNHNYYDALTYIITQYNHLKNILNQVLDFDEYFEPIIDFDFENNSRIDYGINFIISGTIVSYFTPDGTISFAEFNNTFIFYTTLNHSFLYESNFTVSLIGTNYGSLDETSNIIASFYDGVQWSVYHLFITFISLDIEIISPFNNMLIDFSYAENFTIIGSYFSLSNDSKIEIIYGSYWYVHDYSDFDTYWIDIPKSSGNEWYWIANKSYFTNGLNSIKVRIHNDIISEYDEINLNITGLPEKLNDNITSTTSSPVSNNNTGVTKHSIINIDSRSILVLIFTLFTIGFFGNRVRIHWNSTRKLNKIDRIDNINETKKLSTKIKELRTHVEGITKLKDKEISPPKNKTIFSRRRK